MRRYSSIYQPGQLDGQLGQRSWQRWSGKLVIRGQVGGNRQMSAAQARRRFRRLLVLVQQNTVVIITRLGKPDVYMVPVWLYESWMTALRSASEGESSQDTDAPASPS